METKKLSIVMNANEDDKFAWSGVNYNIINSLKKYFKIRYFKATPHYSFLARMIIKIDKFFHKNAKQYPNVVNRLLYKKCLKNAAKYSDIMLTTISTYAAYNKNKNCVYIVDAVYRSLFNYYYFDVDKADVKRLDSIQRKALAKSKTVIFASDWSLKEAAKHYSVDSNKSYVVLMGANLDDIKVKPKNIYKKHDINFLFMGADYERKGLDKVIVLMDLLNKKDSSHKYLLNVVGKQGINTPTIKYFGFLKKTNEKDFKTYIDLYKDSDFFISLPRAECFGIVYCESSMFFLPSISVDTGGISSYLIHNKNGLLFKQTDSLEDIATTIIKLIYDTNRYNEISQESRHLYELYFNWNKWAETVSSIIKTTT